MERRWRALFDTPAGRVEAAHDAAIFALGGASWPRLGSDGHWTTFFAEREIAISPLKPSNCGFAADFSDLFRARFEGQPLQGIELRFEDASARGEAVVTKTGLEGGAIYALSPLLRDAIERDGEAILAVDLRPGLPAAELERALARPRGKQSFSNFLRKAVKLSPAAVGLLQEAAHRGSAPLSSMGPAALAALIKAVPVRLTATAGIERAISTAGGVAFEELDAHFMLRRMPGSVRRGRNAGLGSANRRLSSASLLFDRSGGSKRSNRVVGQAEVVIAYMFSPLGVRL